MSNLLCLVAARTWFLTTRAATDGDAYNHAPARLVCYQSTETHMSISKAARTMGLPPSRIRDIPVTADLRMDIDALRAAVEVDRAAGLLPFCVVSNLGTVGTGAIDPLPEVTRLCRKQACGTTATAPTAAWAPCTPTWQPTTTESPSSIR